MHPRGSDSSWSARKRRMSWMCRHRCSGEVAYALGSCDMTTPVVDDAIFVRDGVAVIPNVLPSETIALLRDAAQTLCDDDGQTRPSRTPAGVRDVVSRVPLFRAAALSDEVRALVEPVLGSKALL